MYASTDACCPAPPIESIVRDRDAIAASSSIAALTESTASFPARTPAPAAAPIIAIPARRAAVPTWANVESARLISARADFMPRPLYSVRIGITIAIALPHPRDGRRDCAGLLTDGRLDVVGHLAP